MKERTNIAKLTVTVIIIVLIIFFIVNLFAVNRKSPTSDEDVHANITTISEHDFSDVQNVEKQIKTLEDKEKNAGGSGSQTSKSYYKKLFAGSVVLGDSVTEGLTVYGYLSSDQVFSKVGASLLSCSDFFTTAAKIYPKNAFFAFGMNDMGNFSGNAPNFTKKYKDLLATFHKISPDTKMYICSISTPSQKAINRQKILGNYKKFNGALKEMCNDTNYLTYIDVSTIFVDHPELYEGDGIHAKSTYYPYWLDMMAGAAKMN